MDFTLYYATNRGHEGDNRWQPDRYGSLPSKDSAQNLRFGKVVFPLDEKNVEKFLRKKAAFDTGDGEGLAAYVEKQVSKGKISAYREKINAAISEQHQEGAKFGSRKIFDYLRGRMEKNHDVLVYIHGFNVSWEEAVAAAAALELTANRNKKPKDKKVIVMLFSWPSDGKALPFVSYKSDRFDAEGSGYAVGRSFLKLRDFLSELKHHQNLKQRQKSQEKMCEANIHLLCHSMGNYVLQNALKRVGEFTATNSLPRVFEHIFLCAPDVDDNVLEEGKPLGRLHELALSVTLYYNTGDIAMYVSDYTKGHPQRLGENGAARPILLHNKYHQVNCSSLVSGLVEHSYYLWGPINSDIVFSIDGIPQGAVGRSRVNDPISPNAWKMLPNEEPDEEEEEDDF